MRFSINACERAEGYYSIYIYVFEEKNRRMRILVSGKRFFLVQFVVRFFNLQISFAI